MDTLPPELHAYICQAVCIDEGDTIRAVNQVSKYFHDVARPYLYHTVSAVGLRQIIALLDRLGHTPSHLRQVHHLFLSDLPHSKSSTAASQFRLTLTECNTIMRLVILSAPTLQTFSFFAASPFSSTSLIGRIFRVSFPHLHTLAISGFYPFPSIPGNFPSLARLHLDGNRNPQGLFQVSGLEEACPALTDLKVSGLGAAASFILELTEALRDPTANSDSMIPTRLPSRLRRLALQAGPEPSGCGAIVTLKDQAMMMTMGVLTVGFQDTHGVQLSVLERSKAGTCLEDLRRDWLKCAAPAAHGLIF
ncbi:hypothetical protein CPB84DRAFT_1783676 [Gymnopilus junonius]|uniref:F-box domain-containing protein n=1 Tax=Gymnopilus junonius TaxID=109634 RepID=A0A9P5NM34_GYMJU|nr:hypothetical protein CPB84DRAFT_1783676 [Gymnopilus junonius]